MVLCISHLNEFPRSVVEPLDVDLFIAVVSSSETLRVDNELHVLDLMGRWLAAESHRCRMYVSVCVLWVLLLKLLWG
jgi:hypothetical protein